MALGFFLALLPLPGINLPLGILLAKLLRFNIMATTLPALLMTYVSPFLYILNYKTGAFIINTGEAPPQLFTYNGSFWQSLVNFFTHAGPAYLLGSALNATMAALCAYFGFLYLYKNISKFIKNRQIKGFNLRKRPLFQRGRIKNSALLKRFRKK